MAARRKKAKRKRAVMATSSLAEMSAEDFMAGFGSSDEVRSEVNESPGPKKIKTKLGAAGSTHQSSLSKLAKSDPEFYKFLRENDQQLLEFGNSGDESEASEAGEGGTSVSGVAGEDSDGVSDEASEDSDDDGLGEPEPRPRHVTSRREHPIHSDQERGDAGEDSDASDPGGDSEASDPGEDGEAGDLAPTGTTLTQITIEKWVHSIQATHSLRALRHLTQALHSVVGQMLDKDSSETVTMATYHVESASVFNFLVVACLKHIKPCLDAHIPPIEGRSGLPSSQKGWSRVKKIVKPYLSDLLSLITSLQDPTMQCAVIRNIRSLAKYVVCLGKLCRGMDRQLVQCWATGDHHVQVMAFLALRETTLLRPHPLLSDILKKLYMAFVRNSKFTSAQSLPRVRFMQNCLVELLSLDPPTTYQHGFVYIRQLAIHLRAAITSGKKEAQQAVYNWQFVHCLDLWAQILGHVTDSSLRPLIYPLVQVVLGTITLQPSSRYFPLRLHLVRTLIDLARRTGTFIPTAPFLLEVLESCGTNVSSRMQTGKPPDLSLLLRATKPQVQSRSYQSAVLNSCFELLLEFAASHSHLIGFPELMFPITTRIRKVAKSTPYSWLRLQLQQLLGKVEEVAKETERDRERVDFSPNQTDRITAWEQTRKDKENSISKFLATWVKVHSANESTKDSAVKTKPHPPSKENEESVASENDEDVVEDFDLSSAESD